MENKENKKMTLDKLAVMVARGFEKTATKEDIKDVNQRINKVDKRLGKVEYQVEEAHDILKRFEENDILNLQKRVQILEKAVRAMSK